jgi:hypothetical protein
MNDRPVSEEYRIAAKAWVEADAAARLLEESKSTVLAQRMAALGDIPAARAERDVKSTPEWADYVNQMVEARTRANLLKAKLEWIRMRFHEWQSVEASKRAEMRL